MASHTNMIKTFLLSSRTLNTTVFDSSFVQFYVKSGVQLQTLVVFRIFHGRFSSSCPMLLGALWYVVLSIGYQFY